MIRLVKQFFSKIQAPKTDFSEFFTSASAEEKKKVFKAVIEAANKDQRDLVERYEQMKQKPA